MSPDPDPDRDSAPVNAATAQARTLLDELVRGGVAHVVVCPGSRSAALAFAAHAAASRDDLTLHTRLDERTAGFLALGLARTSRRPVAVVTTSGTATANLHPAVLEASHAGLPLVVLTADRPAHLRGTGANQTTDQVHLYGTATRLFADVPAGAPGHSEDQQVAGWRSLVARALAAASGHAGPPPGPVHLNVQLDGPMTPDAPDGWSSDAPGRARDLPWTRSTRPREALVPRPAATAPAEEDPWDDDVPTVVVAGDDAGPPARVLAEERGWPLLAEPSSGSRTGANAVRTYRLLLGDADLAGRIRRVVVAGHPTLSRPVTRLLSRDDVEVVALRDRLGGWTDPGHRVSRVLDQAPLRPATAPGAPRAERPAPGPWLREWLDRDADVGARLDALLDATGDLTPQHVAGEVAAALVPGGLLFVGASNPVRDLDLMVPRYDVGARRMVVANRGLSGIDGIVSSAIGAALGRPRSTRSLALVGDVTFLHDTTGLVLGPDEARPDLTIVVVNDDGGSIFALLEQGAPEHAGSFERLFATPHGVDLASLCAATGTTYVRAGDRAELRAALAREPQGILVVEAVVRRDTRRDLDAAIRALVG
ncbi:2-succinyl-5-enolpyruvyl-6-hydroxy-3-cyclohexene-1-carboxylic-acid synthase [Nocardioides sp. HDW12B]|uniref:2-succinyl-5-enolpyruvyl-6-hydroxy-3- cyclohexene-1-carboxylic-acid synthase n=1 Tax=Nocardioides sp. HDW12B TaxID=2714939 RepID=UPI001408B6BE|nr:2-succinyl-5-enolpyruvyl-6-hydroxy-3-cyclohexene-1-carboxylic-acid synthase [Nocardioides sp. HDW12B]QIK65142.1 2-succinyl-5-enolpyruvyl-6-hydroxy-3-cyclohexene-1-carboxylic-acid synthase [Nocardioides sp. HDW12B]